MHDYIPDRMWDNSVHLDRVKILQAALSSFKGERETGNALFGFAGYSLFFLVFYQVFAVFYQVFCHIPVTV